MQLRAVLLTVATLALLAPVASALFPPIDHAPSTVPIGIPTEGPDVPTSHAADAVVTAFQDEYWHNTEGARTHLIVVPTSPTGSWDRIILNYRQYPSHDVSQQDPWDRLCSAGIAGVEVLRCTTPRTDFTLRKDVTAFANLMPPGGSVGVQANTGSYDQAPTYQGGQYVTVTLEFYANEPTKYTVDAPAKDVLPAWYYRGTCANAGAALSSTITFPDAAPASATVEVTLSGHGNEEDYFLDLNERVWHVLVDGHEIGQVFVLPYTYAFIGSYGADYSLHPYMWWTAQQALDLVGVHTGVGEIPAYRITVLPTDLPLLTGTHTVQLVGENGGCYWPSSLSFLLG